MKNIFKILIAMVLFSSCTESFIEEYRNNPEEIGGDVYWSNPDNAQSVLTSGYAMLTQIGLYSRQFHTPFCLMTHEAELDYLSNEDWNQFNTLSITPSNGQVSLYWNKFYEVIRDANDLIEHEDVIREYDELTEEQIDDMLGQAYFLRAFVYHHLAALWSEAYPADDPEALSVPLLLEVAKTESDFYAPRATVNEVYEQMEKDFQKAIELLPPDDPRKTDDAGRVSVYAAHGYLGKIYLYQKKYQEAIDEFEEIIQSGHFELMDTMRNVYNGQHEFNQETILEFNYSDKSEGLADAYKRGTFNHFTLLHGPIEAQTWGNFYVSDFSIERFGDDPRLEESVVMIGDKVVATPSGLKLPVRKYPTTRKFYNPEEFGTREPGWTTNIVPMRLSDIYLLYAEAKNAIGQDGDAREYMNKVRRRAYYKPVDTPDEEVDYNISGNSLRDTIREERWRELHYEMHRLYDIIRWGIMEEEVTQVEQTASGPVSYDDHDRYFPIPANEVRVNPNMIQSDGYK